MGSDASQVDMITQDINQKMKEQIQKLKIINIMVIGKSGVGKTYLTNTVFGLNTDDGLDETVGIHSITRSNRNLRIYDCQGFEPDENKLKQIKKEIFKKIEDGVKSKDIKQHIHCIWYCIGPESHRFNEGEVNFIKSITDKTTIYNIPVIVVLTQSFDEQNTKEMTRKVREKINRKIIGIVPVMDDLIKIVKDVLPQHLQETLISIQNVSLYSKRKWAIGIICTAVALSVGVSFFDFNTLAHWLALGGIITTMLVSISIDYRLIIPIPIISAIIVFIFQNRKALLEILDPKKLKWIPGIKSAVGSGIATAIIGIIYTFIIDMIYTEKINVNCMSTKEISNYLHNLLSNITFEKVSSKLQLQTLA